MRPPIYLLINENLSNYFYNFTILSVILKNLRNKVACGFDKIPPIALKHLSTKTIRGLVSVLNNALNYYYFPGLRKTAKIIPILKKASKV